LRIQGNIVAVQERRILDWFCARMPPSVSPNQLSAIGVSGALIAFAGYAGSTVAPGFLWLASLGLILHWFGDSMDGSLARWRRTERPRFGHFFDHSIDALGNGVIMLGLGCSLHVRMDVAMAALAGYLLMTVHVLLKQQSQGVFQLSFLAFGPTELRLCLIAMNTSMWLWGSAVYPIGHHVFTPYDLLVALAAATFGVLFVVETARTSRELALLDPPPRAAGGA
jgi:phosphatidylglycerophosphate synthase